MIRASSRALYYVSAISALLHLTTVLIPSHYYLYIFNVHIRIVWYCNIKRYFIEVWWVFG